MYSTIRLKKIQDESNEKNLDDLLQNQLKLLNEIEELTVCLTRPFDPLEYDKCAKQILNGLNELCKNFTFIIKFKNNQIVWDIIIRSFEKVIRSKKDPELRRKGLCLFLHALEQTNHEEETRKFSKKDKSWIGDFIILIDQELIQIYDEDVLPSDIYFINQLMKFTQILLTNVDFACLDFDLFFKIIKFITINTNDSSIQNVLKVLEKMSNMISQEFMFFRPRRLNIKFAAYLSVYTPIINSLLTSYENQLTKAKSNLITDYIFLIECLKGDSTTDMGTICTSLCDKLLLSFNQRLDSLNFDEHVINFYSKVFFRLILFSRDSSALSSRIENMLELMVKIVHKSKKFDLNQIIDCELLKMAYEIIETLINSHAANVVDTNFFIGKYWNILKNQWSETIKHKKGHFAFQLVPVLVRKGDLDNTDYDFFVNKLLQHVKNKEKVNSKIIETEFIDALGSLLDKFYTFEDHENIIEMLKETLRVYFNIGKKMNVIEWDEGFKYFSSELIDSEFDLILKHDDLLQMYFDLCVQKMDVDQLKYAEMISEEFNFNNFAVDTSYFMDSFCDMFKTRITHDIKYQLIDFIDYLASKSTDDEVFKKADVIIPVLNEI